MKLVVSAQGQQLASPVDPRFGRAAYLVLVDTESGEIRAVDNTPNQSATQGAGIQAATTVCHLGADCLITGHCGPKAFQALQAGGVEVYTGAAGTVAEAMEQHRAGSLHRAERADVEGHHR